MLTKHFDFYIESAEIEHNSCYSGNCSLVKTAGANPLDEVDQKKDHAYLFVIAMGAGDFYGENNNGDFFYEKDLLDYYKTFESAGVFVQHFNKDPSKSIGKVLSARYNNDMHRVELVIEIPKKKSPDHYEAIKNGERIKVSMGVKVPKEMCSYCGAITKGSIANRCEHLKFMMHQTMDNGQVVYAINMPPMNFFDISIVRKPADAQGHALFQKVASDNNDAEVEELDKIAELVKYMDAMKTMPNAVSDDELVSMKHRFSPDTIRRIIISKRIFLKPSEAMLLGTDLPLSKMDECREVCDTEDFLKFLIEKSESDTCPFNIKTAGKIDYTNPTISKLVARTELVKTAAGQEVNAVGRRKILSTPKKSVVRLADRDSDYGRYKVYFQDGNTAVVKGGGFGIKKKVPEYYKLLVDEGYAHSITGILPSGHEKIVYGGV